MVNKRTRYKNKVLIRDLESLMGKRITIVNDYDYREPFPQMYTSTISGPTLYVDEDIPFKGDDVWAYHLGLKIMKETGIPVIFYNEDASIGFLLPEIERIKVPEGYNRIIFESKGSSGVEMIYSRVIAENIDEAFKYKRNLVAVMCGVLNRCLDQVSFEGEPNCYVILDWKVPGLNGRNYRKAARMLKALERTFKENSKISN